MRRCLQWVGVLLTLAALVSAPVVASAQSKAPRYSVQYWPEAEPGKLLVLVSSYVPTSTALPTVLRVPLPAGAEVYWAGEITGRGPETDIPREFRVVQGTGGSSLQLTVESSREVQYEALMPTRDLGRGKFGAEVVWVQSEPADSVEFRVGVERTVESMEVEPRSVSQPAPGPGGAMMYALPAKKLKPGESQKVSMTYELAAQRAAAFPEPKTRIPTSRIVLFTAGALLVFVLVLLFVTMARSRVAPPAEDAQDDAEGELPEEQDGFAEWGDAAVTDDADDAWADDAWVEEDDGK